MTLEIDITIITHKQETNPAVQAFRRVIEPRAAGSG